MGNNQGFGGNRGFGNTNGLGGNQGLGINGGFNPNLGLTPNIVPNNMGMGMNQNIMGGGFNGYGNTQLFKILLAANKSMCL